MLTISDQAEEGSKLISHFLFSES